MTTITVSETTNLPIEILKPHPSNRPLGLNLEKIEQIKASISQYGFYSNQPIVVRPVNSHYEIIKGEHRFVAAKELGFDAVPCSVQEMSDAEALVQLIIGNIQTENKPLEIGLNAMEYTQKHARDNESVQAYAEKSGVNYKTLTKYIEGAEVYDLLKNFLCTEKILEEHNKLAEVGRCKNKSDWLWLHNFILENELSLVGTIAICKSVRDLDDAIAPEYMTALFDGTTIKKRVAQEVFNGEKSKTLTTTTALAKAIQEAYGNLDAAASLYTYDIQNDTIVEEVVNLQSNFIATLREQKKLDTQIINKIAIDMLNRKQRMSRESAESTQRYYRETKNKKEAQALMDMEQRLDKSIFDAWLACVDLKEIATQHGVSLDRVNNTISRFSAMAGSVATFTDLAKDKDDNYIKDSNGDLLPSFDIPIYNVWTFAKKTNEITHFGNSEQRIVENLLYLYTEPFDIVFDPFAGGGATIDVCKKRHRRYWISDRKPVSSRDGDIRQHDLVLPDGKVVLPDLYNLWLDVTLTYLDPPYWRQAAGQYSDDPTDLANMHLEQFTSTMVNLIEAVAYHQPKGHIALLIQPTQWSADNKQFTDHVLDITRAVCKNRLVIENRVSVPYATEQYNAQQVEYAKANKKLLVLTRELIIWRLI